jgi:hypothetical protein
MREQIKLKIAVGTAWLLMLGGTVLADSVSTFQTNAVNDSKGVNFVQGGVPRENGSDQAINPCNCNPDGTVVRNDLGKATPRTFTAGSFTLTIPATEPTTGLFLGLGLAVVGLMRRRRKKPFEKTVWENLG